MSGLIYKLGGGEGKEKNKKKKVNKFKYNKASTEKCGSGMVGEKKGVYLLKFLLSSENLKD